jgi:hypothetical protein
MARAAWKSLVSGKSDWTTVPTNVESDHAAPTASGEAPLSAS